MCSFWYVDALPHAADAGSQARAREDVHLRQPVGLYAEEIGPDGAQLGNFPQASTHFSLISAAASPDRALG